MNENVVRLYDDAGRFICHVPRRLSDRWAREDWATSGLNATAVEQLATLGSQTE